MTRPSPPPAPPPRRRGRWALAALAIVGLGAILAAALSRPAPLRPPPIPDPNGYDRLVHASRLIEGPAPNEGDIAGADAGDLRAWALANREALDLADEGLALPSAVPLRFSQGDADIGDLGRLRELARLMLADALVSREEGRIGEAADRSVAILRLGRQGTRDGLMIHALIGFAIERTGIEGLRLLRDDLDEDEARALSRTLLAFDEDAPNPEGTLALEAAWARATMPRGLRAAEVFVPGVRARLRGLLAPAVASFRHASRRASAMRRLMAVDLAVRAYRVRTGRLPDRLERLVPEFLPALPADPYGDGPPAYRLDEGAEGFALFSVGPDGRDDGGTPYRKGVDWTTTPGDLTLDPPSP